MSRFTTAGLLLLLGVVSYRLGYKAGYTAARLDALPWWHISRARKAQTLRYMDAMRPR